MKEKLTKNLGVKLLSVPFAIIIWIVIINIDDPVSTRTITNVPVEILNEADIAESGQVYDIVEGKTVSISIRAKRTIRDKVKASDFRVTANLAEITQFNRVEIVAECTKYTSDPIEIIVKPKMLTVTLEDSATKTLPVLVTTTGVVDSGYYVDSVKASPNMIEVTGAESVVEQVAEVRVSVDVSGNQDDFKKEGLVPKAYDEKGREMDSSKLEFSHSGISVKAAILPTKMVPVVVTPEGEPTMGYAVAEVEFGPEQIEIAGKAENLGKVFSIPIKVNVTDVDKNLEKDVELATLLPEGIRLVGDTTNIAVRITIERMAERDFILSKNDISIQNLLEDHEAIFLNESIPVTFIGEKEDLDKLTIADLKAYIDLEGLEAGEHEVNLAFYMGGNNKISGTPTVKVQVKLIVEEEPEEPQESEAPPIASEEPDETIPPE